MACKYRFFSKSQFLSHFSYLIIFKYIFLLHYPNFPLCAEETFQDHAFLDQILHENCTQQLRQGHQLSWNTLIRCSEGDRMHNICRGWPNTSFLIGSLYRYMFPAQEWVVFAKNSISCCKLICRLLMTLQNDKVLDFILAQEVHVQTRVWVAAGDLPLPEIPLCR